MLSAIGRAAVRRVVAARPQTTNPALRSLSQVQLTEAALPIRSSFYALQSCLPSHRQYATAAAAAPKKAVKPKTKAGSTAAKKTPKKAIKKPAKKRVAKKAKPKAKPVKKVLTEAQKERLAVRKAKEEIKVLKVQALSPPHLSNFSAWTVFFSEQAKGTTGGVVSKVKEASVKYKALGPGQLETYNHKANEQNATERATLKQWVEKHTPDEIRLANNARRLLKVKDTRARSQKWAPIPDDRKPKGTLTSFMLFNKDRHASGDFKNIPVAEAAKLIGKEWTDRSSSERKEYDDRAEADKRRYVQEYQTVFGREPGFVTKKAVA